MILTVIVIWLAVIILRDVEILPAAFASNPDQTPTTKVQFVTTEQPPCTVSVQLDERVLIKPSYRSGADKRYNIRCQERE